MKTTDPVDAARVELLLGELRLPAIKLMWADLAARADKEGSLAARYLAALAEQEVTERARRRIERHLTDPNWSKSRRISEPTKNENCKTWKPFWFAHPRKSKIVE